VTKSKILLIIAVIIFLGGAVAFTTREHTNGPIVCTADAKLCPDGSFVGREGPMCEFTTCPEILEEETKDVSGAGSTTSAVGYVSGHVSIGPNCPVEQVGKPCPPPPAAYSSREVVVYEKDGITIKEKSKINAQGDYKITLAPGIYFIQINPAGIGPGEKKQVTIVSTQTSTIDFDIDTGIR